MRELESLICMRLANPGRNTACELFGRQDSSGETRFGNGPRHSPDRAGLLVLHQNLSIGGDELRRALDPVAAHSRQDHGNGARLSQAGN